MLTDVFQNVIKALLIIFYQDIMNLSFTFIPSPPLQISFAKSIRLTTSIYKDYSIRNDIALEDLLLFILVNADAKLLKQ